MIRVWIQSQGLSSDSGSSLDSRSGANLVSEFEFGFSIHSKTRDRVDYLGSCSSISRSIRAIMEVPLDSAKF